jgi:hypothetical protein
MAYYRPRSDVYQEAVTPIYTVQSLSDRWAAEEAAGTGDFRGGGPGPRWGEPLPGDPVIGDATDPAVVLDLAQELAGQDIVTDEDIDAAQEEILRREAEGQPMIAPLISWRYARMIGIPLAVGYGVAWFFRDAIGAQIERVM